MFVSFEGGEGAGKSTLLRHTAEALRIKGVEVVETRAPGGTALGVQVRQWLLHKREIVLEAETELFLFLADRSQHMQEVIVPALREGKLVLCDRFHDSTIAYQSGARGFERGWVRKLCDFASRGVWPDVTFYLDITPEEGLGRVRGRERDKIEGEGLEFHRRLREAYLGIAREEGKRVKVLDARKSVEELVGEVLRLIWH